ncbi:hypothetical protein WG66_010041 [Moniliophthora roreri]|nr:hypothetical protein WG66_010041 [Moniliophthora roreri]
MGEVYIAPTLSVTKEGKETPHIWNSLATYHSSYSYTSSLGSASPSPSITQLGTVEEQGTLRCEEFGFLVRSWPEHKERASVLDMHMEALYLDKETSYGGMMIYTSASILILSLRPPAVNSWRGRARAPSSGAIWKFGSDKRCPVPKSDEKSLDICREPLHVDKSAFCLNVTERAETASVLRFCRRRS